MAARAQQRVTSMAGDITTVCVAFGTHILNCMRAQDAVAKRMVLKQEGSGSDRLCKWENVRSNVRQNSSSRWDVHTAYTVTGGATHGVSNPGTLHCPGAVKCTSYSPLCDVVDDDSGSVAK